jgi:hypothetical protein
MADADEDFGLEVEQMWLIFVHIPTANTTQQDPHGPDDPFRTINYPHLDISDMMEWMSRMLVGEMAGADEDFGLWKLDKCGLFLLASQLL